MKNIRIDVPADVPYERKWGWEQIKRERYIAEHIQSPLETYPVFYQQKTAFFPLIRVPIELPMYRLENGRTVSKHEEYLAVHPELGADYFERDKNSVEVQEVQHALLLDLVKSTELDKYFKEQNRQGLPQNLQRDPLICTPEGFVVNGNRRLCCWRELYYNDKVTYQHFRYVEAVILPVTDEDAIIELEADLQIAPDIQADYPWHAEALMMQRRRDIQQETPSEIAKKFRKGSGKEVERLINMRALAAEYLAWRGPEFDKRWSKVDENEFAFRELVDQMSRLSAPTDKELFKMIGFSLIRDSVHDSDYRRIKDAKKYFRQIIQELKREFTSPHPEPSLTSSQSATSEALDLLLGGAALSPDTREDLALLDQIRGLDAAEKVAESVEETIDRETLFDKEAKKATFLTDQARAANTILQSALSIDLRDPDLISDGLREQLTAIEASVAKLKEWLNEHDAHN